MPIAAQSILPTALDSASIRDQIAAEVRRRSVFSARATHAGYLRRLRDLLSGIERGQFADAVARRELKTMLDALGYDSATGGFPGDSGIPPADAGTLQDLSSNLRIKLQLETNVRMARSVAQAKAGSSPYALREFPAWSLERVYGRRVPRDWSNRWQAAGDSVGWDGAARGYPSPTGAPRMIALKSSPIWAAIGDGAGGFEDTLGNPYPPFAFGSGMGWREAPKSEAQAAGLGESEPADVTLSPGEQEISDALGDLGDDFTARLLRELGGGA
jgi:hypothetical protein